MHDLSETDFNLAKDIIRKRGCPFCNNLSLKYLGLIRVKFQCKKCGIIKEYNLPGGKSFKDKIKELTIRCPRRTCLSTEDWKHIESTVIDEPDPN